jgi:hypothetical protein
MAAVGDAPKIAKALAEQHRWALDDDLAVTDPDVDADAIGSAVKEFYDKPWDEQAVLVPELDKGHSGNTFGGAVALARALLSGEKV